MEREEIKIRQLTNQHLIEPFSFLTVVRDLCGVQAQFMSNALHALKIRSHDYDEEMMRQTLVKNWTLRGTVHVFAKEDLPLFVRCCDGAYYRKNEWRGYTFWNQREKWALTPDRQKYFADVILNSLDSGIKTRDELKARCREYGMTDLEADSMFESWGGGIRELCERGFMHYVVQEKKAFAPSPHYTPMPEDDAKLIIARRYFENFGPATIHDAMYFLGAKQKEVKLWLSQLPVQSVLCDGKTYYFIENGRSYDEDMPSCLFLAGFDPLMLGYQKKESLYLPEEHLRGIFNLAGIVMPSILLNGHVVGRWKKKGGKLTLTLFEALSAEDRNSITQKAEMLWKDILSISWEEI